MNLNQRIKKVRLLLNKSQQDLADELNVTKQAISNIETAKCAPSINLLSKLVIDYGINLNYVVAGIGSIFLNNEKTNNELKNSILKEVEKMLEERGI